jgi:hypothetical protein
MNVKLTINREISKVKAKSVAKHDYFEQMCPTKAKGKTSSLVGAIWGNSGELSKGGEWENLIDLGVVLRNVGPVASPDR